jgi:hypothetical protein
MVLGHQIVVGQKQNQDLAAPGIGPGSQVSTTSCLTLRVVHGKGYGYYDAGIVGGWSEDEQGGIGGRRTSEVFVKTTKRVESDTELFANYGTKFPFAGGCVCHLCRPLEA